MRDGKQQLGWGGVCSGRADSILRLWLSKCRIAFFFLAVPWPKKLYLTTSITVCWTSVVTVDSSVHRLRTFEAVSRVDTDMDAVSAPSSSTASTTWSSFARPGRPSRNPETNSASWAGLTHPSLLSHVPVPGHGRRASTSSATWTSSSGDLADLSDFDDSQGRDELVQEYNRLARKVGSALIRPTP